MLADLKSRAEGYSREPCRAVMLAENMSRWAATCSGAPGHSKRFDTELCGGGKQIFRSGVTKNGRRAVTYVRNQKAASQLLTYELAGLLDLEGPPRQGVSLQSSAPANASTFVFSFVRDPLDAALDAYLELRHLATLRSPQYRGAIARAVGGPSSKVVNPCRGQSDATQQFISFLKAVRRGDPLGGDAYHAYPQALKLDHVRSGSLSHASATATADDASNGGASERGKRRQSKTTDEATSQPADRSDSSRDRGYDAIGTVENFEAGVLSIRALLGLPEANLTSILLSRRHSHRHDSCAKVDRHDAALAALACEVYAADYVCFGYSAKLCGRV